MSYIHIVGGVRSDQQAISSLSMARVMTALKHVIDEDPGTVVEDFMKVTLEEKVHFIKALIYFLPFTIQILTRVTRAFLLNNAAQLSVQDLSDMLLMPVDRYEQHLQAWMEAISPAELPKGQELQQKIEGFQQKLISLDAQYSTLWQEKSQHVELVERLQARHKQVEKQCLDTQAEREALVQTQCNLEDSINKYQTQIQNAELASDELKKDVLDKQQKAKKLLDEWQQLTHSGLKERLEQAAVALESALKMWHGAIPADEIARQQRRG